MEKTAIFNGQTVSVVDAKGGWTTIIENGSQKKVRNGQLSQAPKAATKTEATSAAPAPEPTQTQESDMAKSNGKTKAKKAPKVKAAKANSNGAHKLVPADLTRYKKGEGKTAAGRPTLDIGDKTATKLRGMSLDETYKVVSKATGESESELRARYKKLNPGMQRMNLGNKLRAVVNAQ
jgi:hypothetical protein